MFRRNKIPSFSALKMETYLVQKYTEFLNNKPFFVVHTGLIGQYEFSNSMRQRPTLEASSRLAAKESPSHITRRLITGSQERATGLYPEPD
jgi:hypothetical protein